MKYLPLFLALFLLSCQQQTGSSLPKLPAARDTIAADTLKPAVTAHQEASLPADQLILPGLSIGQTRLGLGTDSLALLLGRPDLSDAAMGKAWLTWKGKKDEHNNRAELNIYTTYADGNMREKVVKQIRTTSSFFKTKENIGVYSSLEALQKHFPDLKAVGHYKDGSRIITIYDAARSGIAFEAAAANGEEICTGVIVHPKGKEVLDVYLYFRPELERL